MCNYKYIYVNDFESKLFICIDKVPDYYFLIICLINVTIVPHIKYV